MSDSIRLDQLDRIEAQQVVVLSKLDAVLAKLNTTNPVDPVDPPPPPPTGKKPGDILDLAKWTLMLPTGSEGDPDNTYALRVPVTPGMFYVDDTNAVVFETPADGFHSSGSKFPRTELREMADTNWTKAAWPSGPTGLLKKPEPARSMECDMAIDTSGLSGRKRICGQQIHDGGDDVIQVVAHESGKLGLLHNDGASFEVIDPAYQNGARFTSKIVTTGTGRIQVFYNGVKKVDIPKTGTGWYFKTGSYIQSGGASTYIEPPGARGRVKIWNLTVT